MLAEAALRESVKMNESLSEVQNWLNSTNERMKAMPALHLDVQSITIQLDQLQVIYSFNLSSGCFVIGGSFQTFLFVPENAE